MDSKIKSMFRAYDIRGDTTEELTPDVMERIGKAFGTYVSRETEQDTVVIGRDARTTSPDMAEAFRDGVASTGVETVVDLGLEPFGVVLFHGWQHGHQAAYITASHLPKEWNGVKFYHPSGVGYMQNENDTVRRLFASQDFGEGSAEVVEEDARQEYIDFVSSKVSGDLDVVIDCGNGVAGLTAPDVFEKAGFGVETLFTEPDGTFPNRESDVNRDSVSKMLRRIRRDADLGIAYDGDADRCFIALPQKGLLQAEETAYLVLNELLKEENGLIVANVECSRLVEDVAEKYDCPVKRVRVGHNFLFSAVTGSDAVFGVEKAGHFAVPQIFPLDDGVAASALFADTIASIDDIDAVLDSMPEYFRDRIAFECPDERKFGVMAQIQDDFVDEYDKTNTIDGVRVDLPEGWILIRASNTSAKIRLTVEAETHEAFAKLKETFSSRLERYL